MLLIPLNAFLMAKHLISLQEAQKKSKTRKKGIENQLEHTAKSYFMCTWHVYMCVRLCMAVCVCVQVQKNPLALLNYI